MGVAASYLWAWLSSAMRPNPTVRNLKVNYSPLSSMDNVPPWFVVQLLIAHHTKCTTLHSAETVIIIVCPEGGKEVNGAEIISEIWEESSVVYSEDKEEIQGIKINTA